MEIINKYSILENIQTLFKYYAAGTKSYSRTSDDFGVCRYFDDKKGEYISFNIEPNLYEVLFGERAEPSNIDGFVTHNDCYISVGGTSLVGYIEEDYRILKKIFGKPTDGDGYKVDAEWEIKFEDGTIATIYNYKDGKNYNGSSGTAKTKIRDWHVGGFNDKALALVKSTIKNYNK